MNYLARWRREFENGARTPATLDKLWRAACHELLMQEALSMAREMERRAADARPSDRPGLLQCAETFQATADRQRQYAVEAMR